MLLAFSRLCLLVHISQDFQEELHLSHVSAPRLGWGGADMSSMTPLSRKSKAHTQDDAGEREGNREGTDVKLWNDLSVCVMYGLRGVDDE